uniref:Uncharacterized protein n=1 Tax=Ascaris lumbricoides TaxID=6252 RepID=A0A0M3IRR5_ASCLU
MCQFVGDHKCHSRLLPSRRFRFIYQHGHLTISC